MFDEIKFNIIESLPKYIFAELNELKLNARKNKKDIIDFSMGNPDSPTSKVLIDKLIESVNKNNTHGYSPSQGIKSLREAISKWYKIKYNISINPYDETIATMGSKEGYINLARAITNIGDVVIVPEPTYPIHSQAFKFAGAKVKSIEISFNKKFELDEDKFISDLLNLLNNSFSKPKFLVLNFPHNPTTTTVTLNFFERVVAIAKDRRFYIISDIAYADITFDGYKTPSIMEIKGAKDVAVESFTLSKSYSMAGWRVGFIVGNRRLINALISIKSWLDYGMFTPIQVAATVALMDYSNIPKDITTPLYKKRRDVLVESFNRAGWKILSPQSTMFVWARIPELFKDIGSLKFSKNLLEKANVVVSPGIGFGKAGDKYVRIALIENEKRIRQASKNIKRYFKSFQ